MSQNPNEKSKNVPSEKQWERTTKNKKFLKKPNNKTARKQFFKELQKNAKVLHPNIPPEIDNKIWSDLETCATIFKVADLSKDLDLEVLFSLSRTITSFYSGKLMQQNSEAVELWFEFARHDLFKFFFQTLIKLRERAISGQTKPEALLMCILCFLTECVVRGKRGRKLLRNTDNFDIISQHHFMESIFFNLKSSSLSLQAVKFLLQISNKKCITKDFVAKYVRKIREFLPKINPTDLAPLRDIQLISQNILESKQGEFFLKIVSELPEEEKSRILPDDSNKLKFLTERFFVLMKCANCEKKEKSKGEFKKCSRCNSIYYCSSACQKAHWPSHKTICK